MGVGDAICVVVALACASHNVGFLFLLGVIVVVDVEIVDEVVVGIIVVFFGVFIISDWAALGVVVEIDEGEKEVVAEIAGVGVVIS